MAAKDSKTLVAAGHRTANKPNPDHQHIENNAKKSEPIGSLFSFQE